MKSLYFLFIAIITFSCNSNKTDYNVLPVVPIETSIRSLTNEEYPDNPDTLIESIHQGKIEHDKVLIEKNKTDRYDFYILPSNQNADTLILKNVNLLEFIPSCPKTIQKDDYLEYIGIVNQEWNRMQVNFKNDQFYSSNNNLEGQIVTRVDLARNCINAYLWEIIAYTNENGSYKPYYHGWFDFPKELYASLFQQRNNIPYTKYQNVLENWKDPESKKIELNNLRQVNANVEVDVENFNHLLYPIIGERKKKAINVLSPNKAIKIDDYLTNKTVFATFSPPGYYNKEDPRKTTLGRLKNFKNIKVSKVKSKINNQDNLIELDIDFYDSSRTTKLIIGGLDTSLIPILSEELLHKGYQMPMGISNHSFYQNVSQINSFTNDKNPFYAFLTDKNYYWLDSHSIGIDGPLFYFSDREKKHLHLLILSFERHVFVGHYLIKF